MDRFITAHGGRVKMPPERRKILDEIKKIIDLAMQKFKEKYGQDARLEEGDKYVFLFKNGVLILSFDDSELGVHFISEEAIVVDEVIGFYK